MNMTIRKIHKMKSYWIYPNTVNAVEAANADDPATEKMVGAALMRL